jgi:arginyl-tRNA synthetase
MRKWALDGFAQTYKRFGIRHDKTYNESEIFGKGKEIVLNGLKKGIFKKDEAGNIIADLGKPLGTKVLMRADGTSVYITQDIYLAKLKYDDFHYTKSVYVVGSEQNYHFKVLFSVLGMLGFRFADGCYHLSHGMIYLPSGRMKSREGTVVDADDIMDELAKMAKKEVESRHRLNKAKVAKLSEIIGLAALKYFLLKFSAQKDFVFNPEEAISFEGETGPYLQYSAVRAKRILEKAKRSPKFSGITDDVEYVLVKKLLAFKSAVSDAAERYAPHILANYAMELAQLFSAFYTRCRVVGSEYETSRLALVKAYLTVISKCLNLLGINVPERM